MKKLKRIHKSKKKWWKERNISCKKKRRRSFPKNKRSWETYIFRNRIIYHFYYIVLFFFVKLYSLIDKLVPNYTIMERNRLSAVKCWRDISRYYCHINKMMMWHDMLLSCEHKILSDDMLCDDVISCHVIILNDIAMMVSHIVT